MQIPDGIAFGVFLFFTVFGNSVKSAMGKFPKLLADVGVGKVDAILHLYMLQCLKNSINSIGTFRQKCDTLMCLIYRRRNGSGKDLVV